MMENQVILEGKRSKAAAPHSFALHLGVVFVPKTANTNWNYTEKSEVKTTRHAALAEINGSRLKKKKKHKRENADNVESTEDKGHQRASLHQSLSAKFHTN